jgi:hypothetical protein
VPPKNIYIYKINTCTAGSHQSSRGLGHLSRDLKKEKMWGGEFQEEGMASAKALGHSQEASVPAEVSKENSRRGQGVDKGHIKQGFIGQGRDNVGVLVHFSLL